MKNIICVFTILCFSSCIFAQAPNLAPSGWMSVTNSAYGCSFLMPGNPQYHTLQNTKMYSAQVDTALALNTHIQDSATLDTNSPHFAQALSQQNGDTLRAIAALTLLVTNSDLLSVQNVTINGKTGLEVGIRYKTLSSNYSFFTYLQYFLTGGKLFAFSITGTDGDQARVQQYKSVFFQSININ